MFLVILIIGIPTAGVIAYIGNRLEEMSTISAIRERINSTLTNLKLVSAIAENEEDCLRIEQLIKTVLEKADILPIVFTFRKGKIPEELNGWIKKCEFVSGILEEVNPILEKYEFAKIKGLED